MLAPGWAGAPIPSCVYTHVMARKKKVTAVKKNLRKRGHHCLWSESSMAAAIDAVRNKQMSQRAACKAFEVPRCTLQMRLLGKTELRAKPGRPSALSAEQEEKLVDYTRNQASMGIGFGRFFCLDVCTA